MVIAFSFLRMGTTVGSILPRRFVAVEIRPGLYVVWGLSNCERGKEWRSAVIIYHNTRYQTSPALVADTLSYKPSSENLNYGKN